MSLRVPHILFARTLRLSCGNLAARKSSPSLPCRMEGEMPTSDSTSKSLLRRVRNRDADAWLRFTDLYGPLVYYWARQAGLQVSDAADLGQEVFQVVATRIDSFQHEAPGATFRGWLRVITSNKLKEFGRSRVAAGEVGTISFGQIAQVAEENDDVEQLNSRAILMRRALELIQGDFDSRTWQAFWRTTVDDQSATGVAAELKMTSGNVRQAKYRVLRRLREELDELL